MKIAQFLLMLLYALVLIITLMVILLDAFSLSLPQLLRTVNQLYQFIFSILLLTISLTTMLYFLSIILAENTKRQFSKKLHRLLHHQPLSVTDDSLDRQLSELSQKLQNLTQQVQATRNLPLLSKETLIQQERQRIARDLHDTVSQELFAAVMIVSGLKQSLGHLQQDKLRTQLNNTEKLLTQAQNDLRIMLLHLRPRELEGNSLKEGLQLILQELDEKSALEVSLKENINQLPRTIEEHLFRIIQEFISNTLKHAKASQLDLYLHESQGWLQVKMIDDGCGFDVEEAKKISYGLRNIEDRVADMAGQFTLISAPNQGVTMLIELPLLQQNKKGYNNDKDTSTVGG